MSDPYYISKEWRALRASILRRDGHRCAVAGCPNRASVADHIKPRRDGGADTPENLRSLCEHHHNVRRRGGWRGAAGCDPDGWPLPPGGGVILRGGRRTAMGAKRAQRANS
ncbi:MAG: HNH endonuclease [Acetobacteraceae bacterium]|jgi:5-methylcytosine-specific restriction protein A